MEDASKLATFGFLTRSPFADRVISDGTLIRPDGFQIALEQVFSFLRITPPRPVLTGCLVRAYA